MEMHPVIKQNFENQLARYERLYEHACKHPGNYDAWDRLYLSLKIKELKELIGSN